MTRHRPSVGFIAWSRVAGRSDEIAASLGGEAECIYPVRMSSRRAAPLRYVVSLLLTTAYLLRRRPRAVIVTNPPVFPGLVSLAYGRIARAPVALDSHPSAFGVKETQVAARLMPVHAWLARRVSAVLVTASPWVEQVEAWGGRGIIVHEAPHPAVLALPPSPSHARPRVLFVGTFARDEPVEVVIDAAQRLESVDFLITGDPSRAPQGLLDDMPPNVTLVGFLPFARYVELLGDADVVVSLTTEPTSVMRAAYEAVYAQRLLVVSDWPELRSLFPQAIFVANTVDGVTDGVAGVLRNRHTVATQLELARREQLKRWEEQRRTLGAVLSLNEADPDGRRTQVRGGVPSA